MNRRTLASIALTAACVVGLTACDIHSPDMELGFTANPDGTTTVTGLAADQDQAGTKLLVVVTVDGTTNNAVAANLPAAAWSPQRPFKCGNKDKDGNEQTCFLTVRLGEDHRFTATFTNPTDPEKLVCITPLGVAVKTPTGEGLVTQHTKQCFTAAKIAELTGTTPTTAPPTPVPPTTAAPTTSAAPTTTTEATTTTTMPAPTSTTSTTIFDPGPGPGGPCGPDPMDLSCI